MTASSTLAHAAISDLQHALQKVRAMLDDVEVITWEIVKPIESLEEYIAGAKALQEKLGFE